MKQSKLFTFGGCFSIRAKLLKTVTIERLEDVTAISMNDLSKKPEILKRSCEPYIFINDEIRVPSEHSKQAIESLVSCGWFNDDEAKAFMGEVLGIDAPKHNQVNKGLELHFSVDKSNTLSLSFKAGRIILSMMNAEQDLEFIVSSMLSLRSPFKPATLQEAAANLFLSKKIKESSFEVLSYFLAKAKNK